jgi:hypothetical protein
MAVLSIIPGIGSALVWIPASIILMLHDHMFNGIALLVFCGLVVGSIDNLLRPVLVGKHTDMHELMIFFGTLGGLFMFGMPGLLIGPVIASLFITIWEIYGEAFKDMLPPLHADREPLSEPDQLAASSEPRQTHPPTMTETENDGRSLLRDPPKDIQEATEDVNSQSSPEAPNRGEKARQEASTDAQ